jgi:hypothetical protein
MNAFYNGKWFFVSPLFLNCHDCAKERYRTYFLKKLLLKKEIMIKKNPLDSTHGSSNYNNALYYVHREYSKLFKSMI